MTMDAMKNTRDALAWIVVLVCAAGAIWLLCVLWIIPLVIGVIAVSLAVVEGVYWCFNRVFNRNDQ